MDKKYIVGAIIGVVATLLVSVIVNFSGSTLVGAGQPNRFPNGYIDDGYGYYVNGVEVIGSSRTITAAGITNTGTLTQTGAATLSGTNSLTGTTTISSTLSATKASTITCLKTYDGATTTTAYYIYADGAGSMVSTTTKPALCP